MFSLEFFGYVIVFKIFFFDGGYVNVVGMFDWVVGLLIVVVVRVVFERFGNDVFGEGRRGEMSRVWRD